MKNWIKFASLSAVFNIVLVVVIQGTSISIIERFDALYLVIAGDLDHFMFLTNLLFTSFAAPVLIRVIKKQLLLWKKLDLSLL